MKTAPTSPAAAIRINQGHKIRSFRNLHKMSQATLAAHVGVTKAAVSEWECGLSSPRQHLQIAIAKALQAPWSALFGLDSEAVA